MWAMLGQAAGAGTNWLASDVERRRAQARENGREAGRYQAEAWQRQDDAEMEAYLQAALARRQDASRMLASRLGSPDRIAAGEQVRDRTLGELRGADSAVVAPSRAIFAPGQAFDRWGDRTTGTMQPMIDTRRAATAETAAQRAQASYDTRALNESANTGIDIDRGVDEQRRMLQLRELLRRRMLAANEQTYADRGPSNTSQNLQLMGALLGAGGAAADASTSNRRPSETPDHSLTYDREPSGRPIYNPYQRNPYVERPIFGYGSE